MLYAHIKTHYLYLYTIASWFYMAQSCTHSLSENSCESYTHISFRNMPFVQFHLPWHNLQRNSNDFPRGSEANKWRLGEAESTCSTCDSMMGNVSRYGTWTGFNQPQNPFSISCYRQELAAYNQYQPTMAVTNSYSILNRLEETFHWAQHPAPYLDFCLLVW